ncbi:MAG: GtrA family protein [Clostridia bacterium]|nr:GtrA family protein [Clostridia bacterium]
MKGLYHKFRDSILPLFRKYSEYILYVFFGGVTTVINIVAYWICTRWLGMDTDWATTIAWILAVIVAYVTNRIWVFRSKENSFVGIVREVVSFFGARIATGLMDLGIMHLFVEVLHWPDMPVKIASNVLVIILNYIFSKLFIFRKKKGEEDAG